MQTIILATDLDNTLVGNDKSLKVLNRYLQELRQVNKLKLVYATGRSLHAYKKLYKDKFLLHPDALVAAVGTEIYFGMKKVSAWPQVTNWDTDLIRNQLRGITGLEDQPASELHHYKVSYFLKFNPKTLEAVKNRLKNLKVDVLYSHNLFLDILPRGINKGSALKYLADNWKVTAANIIACGDSANDADMLKNNKAIIVSNAHQELLDWALKNDQGNFYLAKSKYAAGIIEGLQYYKVLT